MKQKIFSLIAAMFIVLFSASAFAQSVSLSPNPVYANNNLVCGGFDPAGFTLKWYENGAYKPLLNTINVPSSQLSHFESWRCEVYLPSTPFTPVLLFGQSSIVVSNYPPVANANGPYTVTEGQNLVFTGTAVDPVDNDAITGYAWDFTNDGIYDSLVQNPTYMYVQNGTFVAVLNATDAYGATGINATNVTVLDTAPVSIFTMAPNPVVEGQLVTFTDLSTAYDGVVAWAWDYDNNGVTDSLVQNPTNTFANGTYLVNLTVTDGDGSRNSSVQTLTVLDTAPTANHSQSANVINEGQSITVTDLSTFVFDPIVSWNWNFGDGFVSLVQNPAAHQYTNNNTYTITQTVTDSDGSQSVNTSTVIVLDLAPTANFSQSANTINEGQSITFTDLSTTPVDPIVSHNWNFGDGSANSALTNPTHVFMQNGTFTVTLTVTDSDGSQSVNTSTVIVNDLGPTALIGAVPLVALVNQTVTFTDLSTSFPDTIANWAWDFGDLNTANVANTTHIYTLNGTYLVTLVVTDSDGSQSTNTTTITINNIPDTTVPGTVTGLVASLVTNQSITWTWANPVDPDFANAIVYFNGVNVVNTTLGTYTANLLSNNTAYTIMLNTIDSSSNINTTPVSLTTTTLQNNGIVPDTTAPATITNLLGTAVSNESISWTWTNPTDLDFNGTIIYLNGVNVANLTNVATNYVAVGLLNATQYTLGVQTFDNATPLNINGTVVQNVTFTLQSPTGPDVIKPSASLISPIIAPEDSFINFNATATDNVAVSACNLYVGGVLNGPMNIVGTTANRSVMFATPGNYNLLANCTDAAGNYNDTSVTAVTITDITPPVFTPALVNQVVLFGANFSYNIGATDNVAFDKFRINDTVNFRITPVTGIITNNTGLVPGVYSLTIFANDTSNNVQQGIITVTQLGPDTSAPIISAVTVSGITFNSALVTFTTDDLANATVNFGTTTALGTSVTNNTIVTAHGVALTGLLPATLYNYNVTSCNAYSNCSTSGPLTFTTAAAPAYSVFNSIIAGISFPMNTTAEVTAAIPTLIFTNPILINNSNVGAGMTSMNNVTMVNSQTIGTVTMLRCTILDSIYGNTNCQDELVDPSTVLNSITTGSTVTNSTIINSTATNSIVFASNITNCFVTASTVNRSQLQNNCVVQSSTVSGNSLVNNATVNGNSLVTAGSTVSGNATVSGSTISASTVTLGATVTNSQVTLGSTVSASTVTNSNVSASTVQSGSVVTGSQVIAGSTITNSSLTNSLVNGSSVTNSVLNNVILQPTSTVMSSTLTNVNATNSQITNTTVTGVQFINAVVVNGNVTSGTVIINGTTYTGPYPMSLTPVAPVASFTFSPAAPTQGQNITLRSTSTDANPGDVLTYSWALNGTVFATTQNTSLILNGISNYNVSLTVTDSTLNTNTAVQVVTVSATPPPPTPTPSSSRGGSGSFTTQPLGSGILVVGNSYVWDVEKVNPFTKSIRKLDSIVFVYQGTSYSLLVESLTKDGDVTLRMSPTDEKGTGRKDDVFEFTIKDRILTVVPEEVTYDVKTPSYSTVKLRLFLGDPKAKPVQEVVTPEKKSDGTIKIMGEIAPEGIDSSIPVGIGITAATVVLGLLLFLGIRKARH